MVYVRTARQGNWVHCRWRGKDYRWTSWTVEQSTSCGECGASLSIGARVVRRKAHYVCSACAPTHAPPTARGGLRVGAWEESAFRSDCRCCLEEKEWREERLQEQRQHPCPHCDGTGINPTPPPDDEDDTPLSGLPTPVRNVLVRNLGWDGATAQRVSQMSDEELLALRGLGAGNLHIIRKHLRDVLEPRTEGA